MEKLIACDVCGVTGAPDEMHSGYDGDDYCAPHWRERELRELKRQRDAKVAWLESTHLKSLREVEKRIAEMEPSARPEGGNEMNNEILGLILGEKIVAVTTEATTNGGAPPEDNQLIVSSITVDGGWKIEFSNEGLGYAVVTLRPSPK